MPSTPPDPFFLRAPGHTPSAGFADPERPRLSAVASRVWLVAWWVALVALVVVAISPWLAWEEGTRGWALLDHTDLRLHGQALQVIFVAPTVLVGAMALARRQAVASGWAAVFALVGCVGVALTLSDSGGQWPGWGAGLAVFAYPLALVALVVLGWLSRQPRRTGGGESARWGHVAAAAAIVAGGGACVGAHWYAVTRVTDRTTAGAAAPAPAGLPPGRVLWRAGSATVFLTPPRSNGEVGSYYGPAVPLASGLVALTDATGDRLEVRSSAGAERWHYAHAGAFLLGAIPATGGRALVAFYQARGDTVAFGFDARTGAIRWQRWLGPVTNDAPGSYGSLGTWLYPTPAAIVVLDPQDPARMVGISTTTGRTEWSASPKCGPGGWGAGQLTVLDRNGFAGCDFLQAFSRAGPRWTDGPQVLGRLAAADARSLVHTVTARDVIVEWDWFTSRDEMGKLAALDPATGRIRFSFTKPFNPIDHFFVAADDSVMLNEQLVVPRRPKFGVGRREFVARDALTGVLISRWFGNDAFAGAIRGYRAYLLGKSGVEVRDLRTGRLIAFYRLKASGDPVSLGVTDSALVLGYVSGDSPGAVVVMNLPRR